MKKRVTITIDAKLHDEISKIVKKGGISGIYEQAVKNYLNLQDLKRGQEEIGKLLRQLISTFHKPKRRRNVKDKTEKPSLF